MKTYAILCHPQALKVYKDDAARILVNEFNAVTWDSDVVREETDFRDIEGISYVVFSAEQEPSRDFFGKIARLSFYFAVFEVKGDMLLPKGTDAGYIFKNNMASILNYQGKTNEYFTRLMINLAINACKTESQGAMNLLDPVAGKGTTLYDAMMLGMNAYGIELSEKYFDEVCHYSAKFLQSEKFKHITKKDTVLGVKSKKMADAYTFEFAADKKSFSSKEHGVLKIFASDTRIADKLIKKNTIDIIVGDLPYGIQHANKKAFKKNEKSRSATELFAESLPSWMHTLKDGGSLVVSFNEHTTRKEALTEILEKNKMTVIKEDRFFDYRHMVDSSIKRNLIVAVKT